MECVDFFSNCFRCEQISTENNNFVDRFSSQLDDTAGNKYFDGVKKIMLDSQRIIKNLKYIQNLKIDKVNINKLIEAIKSLEVYFPEDGLFEGYPISECKDHAYRILYQQYGNKSGNDLSPEDILNLHICKLYAQKRDYEDWIGKINELEVGFFADYAESVGYKVELLLKEREKVQGDPWHPPVTISELRDHINCSSLNEIQKKDPTEWGFIIKIILLRYRHRLQGI